jgi:hypothetical protein
MLCARNTHLETIHAGKTPVARTGDWRDVTVVDADGNRIPWSADALTSGSAVLESGVEHDG